MLNNQSYIFTISAERIRERQRNIQFQMDNISSSPITLFIDGYLHYINIDKNNTSKYKFKKDSNHTCNYCFEKFKSNQIMCINLCYHYWCENCNEKLKINKCGFCRKPIGPNQFIDTFGEYGFFKKNQHCLEVINIIKDDIDLDDIDPDDIDPDDIDPDDIDPDDNNNTKFNQMDLLD